MKASKLLVAALLFSLAHIAHAQCATGIDTGGGNCTPPDAPGLSTDNAVRKRYDQVWIDSWGAIAVDASSLKAGTTEGDRSESEARKVAMANCKQDGNAHCKVVLVFLNQCAALAAGELISYSRGPNKREAEVEALRNCGSAKPCKVFYSACSYPVKIQ